VNVDAALVARPQSGHAQARQDQASQAQAGQAQAGRAQPAGPHPSLAQPAGHHPGRAQAGHTQAGHTQAGHTQAGQAQHGRLLIIGGGEDRCCSTGLLDRFVGLCGGDRAQIVLVTTATGMPDEVHAEYEEAFRKLGAGRTTELRLSGRADADGAEAAEMLTAATGVFLSGGDQSRLRTLVGSRTNDILRERLARGLVVAGTSAGATAMGRTMILGGHGPEVAVAAVRTGPGLGLVPKLLIDMHFGERGRLPRLLSAVALDPDHLGVGIDENTAILVAGTSFEVLGTGVATVADAENSTVVHPVGDCDPITLYDVRLHLLPAGCIFDIGQRTPSIGPAHDRY
jgi:cyanophycinase